MSLFAATDPLDDPSNAYVEVVKPDDNYVEVETPRDPSVTYLQRRSNWSFVFQAGAEQISLPNYYSPSLDMSYTDAFGSSPITSFRGQLGAKWNLTPISISLEGAYGESNASSNGNASVTTSLSVQKMSAGISFYLDGEWSTPYVVPYARLEGYTINYSESNSLLTTTDSTGFAPAYSGGILVDLDFLDSITSRDGYLSTNLKAAFLDIYAIHRQAGASDKLDFSNGVDFGASLRLEY